MSIQKTDISLSALYSNNNNFFHKCLITFDILQNARYKYQYFGS